MPKNITKKTADWLRFGEQHYGEMYSQALEVTEYAYQTLMNAKLVANKIEIYRRRENLTWKHHAEVASLPPGEQDRLLDMAEIEGLSTREVVAKFKTGQVSI